MLPDDRPDGTRWIRRTLRWLVYLARDPRLARDVAIKLLRRRSVADKNAVSRFLAEAQEIAKLDLVAEVAREVWG